MLPVVDLAALLGEEATALSRLVIVRAGPRKVALAVDQITGTHKAEPGTMQDLPPLLSTAQSDLVQAVATLDNELLFVLQTAHLVPEEVWASIPALER